MTLTEPARAAATRSGLTPCSVIGVVLVTITSVLVVDASGTLPVQRMLGAVTWVVLALLLARETPVVRAQTTIVVLFATAVEYTFSPLLEVYVYRFDNVPMYVPPGHGLVYLAALSVGRLAFVQARPRLCTGLVLTVGGVWATYGLLLADRSDALGAFWFLCLAAFLRWGPSRGLYVGAFVVVSYLEIVGTALGTWVWQPVDPTGLISIGNPPSGAAGGYGWFDLAALLLAPALLRWLSGLRRLGRSDRPAGHPAETVAGGP